MTFMNTMILMIIMIKFWCRRFCLLNLNLVQNLSGSSSLTMTLPGQTKMTVTVTRNLPCHFLRQHCRRDGSAMTDNDFVCSYVFHISAMTMTMISFARISSDSSQPLIHSPWCQWRSVSGKINVGQYEKQIPLSMSRHTHMAGIYQSGYFLLIRVTFFKTLRTDLEEYFKCMT